MIAPIYKVYRSRRFMFSAKRTIKNEMEAKEE